jgi:predicted RNA-binding protein YlxR (DUF448 family)
MQNKKPERTCIACRTKGDKSLFIKVVLNKNGDAFVERAAKLDGRGAYICKNIDCAKLCKKNKALNRAFKRQISDSVYEELLNEFTDK